MSWPVFTEPSPNENYNFSYRKKDRTPIRILILIGMLFMGAFLWMYFQPQNRGYTLLFVLLSVSICLKLFRLLHEWYHYWQVVPPKPAAINRHWHVDIFTTYCADEPYEMVINTLRAIQNIDYPHTTYLCDEEGDPYLSMICEELGVEHIVRHDRKDAKAGNINNALQVAEGDICLILDPDHIPVPDFLDHVLPYFQDPKVGFVQCVQGYYNRKESLVAYGATEQTYTFYGPMMTTMGSYGTAQAIGANCTFRRDALDSIGGHAAGLSEDMHTAMQLHAKGWKSVYVPLPLSYGLVPATLSAYYKQQLKWARGTFELLFVTYPRLFSAFTWRQRLHYLTMPLHYLTGVVQLIDLLIPILALVMMRLPLKLDLMVFATAFLPLFTTTLLIRQYAQRWLIEKHEAGFHVLGGILSSGTWWVYLLGLIYTICRVEVPYLPTPKQDRLRNNVLLCLPNILMIGLTLGALGYSIYHYGRFAVSNFYSQLMIGFSLLNVLILTINVVIGQEQSLAVVKKWVQRQTFPRSGMRIFRLAAWYVRHGIYGWLRISAIPLAVLVLLLTTGLIAYDQKKRSADITNDIQHATTQPFYYGLLADEPVRDTSTRADTSMSASPKRVFLPDMVIAPQHLAWPTSQRTTVMPVTADSSLVTDADSPDSSAKGTDRKLLITSPAWSVASNQLPLLYLEPALPETETSRALERWLLGVKEGKRDTVLINFFDEIKRYRRPVLLSFAPGFDDTTRQWGTGNEKLLALYRQAWQYVVRFSHKRNVTNVTWVWCPTEPSTIIAYYPGADCIDWIGVEAVDDPARADDHRSHSFASRFQLMHSTIRTHITYDIRQKPILLTRLGQPAGQVRNRQDKKWLQDALDSIRERYPEIRGILFSREQAKASGIGK
ncbi:glycosyltransferase family 2 protein [Spirosoma sp. KUDC1026]|uniref:glycosyltransferase family 2 protein n=1 Tax=Spirosoma sp. KUDC1026 TaxID=2745947 RepID=UPI00159BB979|nr:glycosyltransferase family 2 protein [Spirosoma sp. KUDC1026]QKZ13409.1 glycosyltransferase [Spirosoma sp. KUDC1026]